MGPWEAEDGVESLVLTSSRTGDHSLGVLVSLQLPSLPAGLLVLVVPYMVGLAKAEEEDVEEEKQQCGS